MTPLFFNQLPNNFYPPTTLNFLPAFQTVNNLNAYNSLIFQAQEQALRNQLLMLNGMRVRMLQEASKPQPVEVKPQTTKIEDLIPPSNPNTPSSILERTPEIIKKVDPPAKRKKKEETQKKANGNNKAANVAVQKEELEEMVMYVLNNIGGVDQTEINSARRKYASKPNLVSVFDTLVSKYLPVKKHREDIIRYVIRRAFKFMKKSIIQKEKIFGKRAYAALCKKYFKLDYGELEKMGVNTQDEKELIEFLLPYRKNSKNRTMNTDFTSEIFSSQEFCQDYKEFLKGFNKSLEEDNSKKTKKLMALAEESVKKNNTDKIKNCTRLPWLRLWVEKTKDIALNLLTTEANKINNNNNQDDKIKKLKLNNGSPAYSSSEAGGDQSVSKSEDDLI